ncbi:MAG: rhodanese-like domain-containing protein [Orrella sp.]|uniref:rhodanese-like domain-containing protein n=2 Tax=Orrella sp. TaxID=1921583 RepID=UPI003BCDF63B
MDFFQETNNLMLIAIAVSSGLMLLWPIIQKRRAGNMVNPTQAVMLINHQDAVVIDVRPLATFQLGHIPNARNVPLGDLDTKMASFPKDKPVILSCDRGQIAVGAAAKLRQAGLTQVSVLEGGLNAWLQAGMPTSTKKK